MREVFEKRLNLILISAILIACIAIGVPMMLSRCEVRTDANEATTATVTEAQTETVTETAKETATDKHPDDVQVISEEVRVNSRNAQPEATVEKSEKKSVPTTAEQKKAAEKAEKLKAEKAKAAKKKKAKTEKATEEVQFATAEPVEHKASYDAQWDAGYLVAIDNPDTSYSCPHVELTDRDRDLLERLCYGEFGTGGFTGAALIAQSVKNAMVRLGTSDVATIIRSCRYTGSTHSGTSQACKDAVVYVFDMDKDAVQHRLLYMYNPTMVSSAFHESQNYICTFKEIRFFDKK